jgi:hypothetical protein
LPECDLHTPCPIGYLAWHEWAESMAPTHRPRLCTGCGKYAIWESKPIATPGAPFDVRERTASIDPTGTYRYTLTRRWGTVENTVVFVGLNPSTADAQADDPTIRRCMRFAADWGFGQLIMVNLFALRSKDPDALRAHPAATGPDNDRVVADACLAADLVVGAWGSHPLAAAQAARARRTGVLPDQVADIGRTVNGQPRHPLYVRGDARPMVAGQPAILPVRWPEPQELAA